MGSKQLGSKFLKRSQIYSHTPSALNAGAKRSGATCHMAMPQCCYLAKGAKRPSHTTNAKIFDRIPFDPCNSIKRVDLCLFDQKNSTYLQPPAYNLSSLSTLRASSTSERCRFCCFYHNSTSKPNQLQKYHIRVCANLPKKVTTVRQSVYGTKP